MERKYILAILAMQTMLTEIKLDLFENRVRNCSLQYHCVEYFVVLFA